VDAAELMAEAIIAASGVRCTTSPNPWVGAALRLRDGRVVTGATQPPGGPHAEIVALDSAGPGAAVGAELAVTLEPCSHHGRTPPCVDALLAAGVARVHVGVVDPDRAVAGSGIAALRAAGVEVSVGTRAEEVTAQLAPYLHHRRTGRPYVVLKLAATLDGGTAAPDGGSQWITGPNARRDVHRLRAESDAVLVGAGTVRADDPALTVRHLPGPDPRRIVLGRAPAGARMRPCTELDGPLEPVLDRLGADGVVQLLVEGGATVAAAFHDGGLVQRYVLYLAPALFGGREARPLLDTSTAPTMAALWRGRIADVRRLGEDIRIDLEPGPTEREP
jgi:diaminohydroxyphosphoribosylaminopyrimidine deaminase / 5-amino-6-(5-phosphoribosylamino)uracil reductase